MDMLNILKKFDAVGKGEKPSADSAAKNEMKTILESLQECGMDMPSVPEQDKVNMNVTLNARGTDAIEELIKLMGGAAAPQDAPVRMPPPGVKMLPDPHDAEMGDMKKMMKITSMGPEEQEEEVEEDGWDNSPQEDYKDDDYMIHDLAGGLNRKKKSYAKAQDGDNPMAVESIKDKLWAALNEKKTVEGKYKSDAQRKAIHANKMKKK